MASVKKSVLRKEFARIKRAGGGILRPKAVVDAAREKSSPLHRYFEWDNTRAAEAYRIWQARQLIVVVTMEFTKRRDEIVTVQQYVSLGSDRKGSGGYRALVDVIRDESKRQEFVEGMLTDIHIFRLKYQVIKEAAEIILAMNETERRVKNQRSSAA